MDDREAKVGAAKPVEIVGEQKLDESDKQLVNEAYARFETWNHDCAPYHNMARDCRRVYRLDDPGQDPPGTPPMQKAIQLQTLKSTINNSVADQMDNTPEALMIPEREEVSHLAAEMTDVVHFIFDQNGYERFHRQRVEDFFITGTAITQVGWDETMDHGKGNIRMMRVPVESMLWDPECEDIQDARAIIKVSWHPLSWFAEHYPDTAKYIRDESDMHENAGRPQSAQEVVSPDEGRAMLMEYWYRRFKGKKYTINVAYIAGGALLDKMENVYWHGQYPFVFDAFTQIAGQPVGEGMVYELTPMMRYINRYAHYIDENLRYSCKPRMLTRKGAQIDQEALADWTRNIVEAGDIGEDAVRWFDIRPLNGMANNMMLQFESDMKLDSGQNQFNRGESAGSITAASAISAMQEAGGKITRMRTGILSSGLKKVVEQILWLVAQFYTSERSVMILGEDQNLREVRLDAEHLMPHRPGERFPAPPYIVQVQIQRRNPMRVAAQNDLFIQAYTMAAQSGQNFPLSTLFELLVVDGKERVLPKIREMEQMQQMMQEMQMQNQQLQEENANYAQSIAALQQNLTMEASDDANETLGGGV